MSATRKHPIDELIRTASEASALMWRCYDTHIGTARYDPKWQEKATEIFAQCNACDERLLRLKNLRDRALGAKSNGSKNEKTGEVACQVVEAEWDVRKFRHLLSLHGESDPRDDDWKARQLRLMSGLRNAIARLVDVSERDENLNGAE
jgi:hypothetical protein